MKRNLSWTERPEQVPNDAKLQNNFIPEIQVKDDKYVRLGMCQSIRMYFREYCANSSLHGIRYLGEKGRTTTERIWWALIFIASIFMCGNLIMKTWRKWDMSPVIVSFAQSPTPVWQVPFPAVTICSETKVRQSIFNFTEAYHNRNNFSQYSVEEKKRFADLSLICDTHLYWDGNKTTDQSAIDLIHEVAPDFEEMLFRCKWTNKLNTTCENLFSPTLTEEGLCYTFNALDSPELLSEEAQNEHYLNHHVKSEWSLDGGYPKGTNLSVYPLRALGAGIKSGLTIVMRAYDYDLDYICRGAVQGFKILLHNPAETPRVGQQYFRAPLNQEVIVAVHPDMMTTSAGLKDYLPSRRHCFFPNEKDLRFFKVYTQQNCEVECLTNYTLQKCGCVLFHMPRSQDTPICGSGSTFCAAKAQTELLLREVETEIAAGDRDDSERDGSKVEKCNCLPACTSLNYNAETSQADFNWPKLFAAYKANFSEFPGIQMTRVNIFFKDTQFITSRRSELYGQTDFLANCGGLLGLFMGFSFLSIIEIFYFLTLRMWCNIKMHGRKMWSAPKIMNLRHKAALEKK